MGSGRIVSCKWPILMDICLKIMEVQGVQVGEACSFVDRTVSIFIEFSTPFSKTRDNPRKRIHFPECKTVQCHR